MKQTYVISTIICTLSMLSWTPSWASMDEFDTELLEVEAAMADSEAAKQEALETRKRMKEEQRYSKKARAEARRKVEKAKRLERKARAEIALKEKQILKAQEDIEQAKASIEEARMQQDKLKLDMQKVNAQLEESQVEREKYVELKKQAVKEANRVEDELAKLRDRQIKVKKMEKKALKELTRAEVQLNTVKKKARKSVKENDTLNQKYAELIDNHRDSLQKISKRLDEIEVEMEVEIAYMEKKARKNIAMKRTRTLASLKNGKFARITSPACNIRTFPGTTSKVLGTYRQGRKVHVKIHDGSWYTTVFKGEKVFMGAGCFQ